MKRERSEHSENDWDSKVEVEPHEGERDPGLLRQSGETVFETLDGQRSQATAKENFLAKLTGKIRIPLGVPLIVILAAIGVWGAYYLVAGFVFDGYVGPVAVVEQYLNMTVVSPADEFWVDSLIIGGFSFLFAIPLTFIAWTYVMDTPPEPITEPKLTYTLVSSADGTLSPAYFGDGIGQIALRETVSTAHDGNISLTDLSETNGNDGSLADLGNREIITTEIGMTESRVQDSFQQPKPIDETAPAEASDTGLPVERIATRINRVDVPIFYQVVISRIDDSTHIHDRLTSVWENTGGATLLWRFIIHWIVGNDLPEEKDEAAKTRIENFSEASGRYVAANVRLIAVPPKGDREQIERAENVLGSIEDIIADILPEYVETHSRTWSTASNNRKHQQRSLQTFQDYQLRSLNVDGPRRSIGGSEQTRRNLILDADATWGLIGVPGAGREETQRAFDVAPREEIPTGEPIPSQAAVLEADDYLTESQTEADGGETEADTDDTEDLDDTKVTDDTE